MTLYEEIKEIEFRQEISTSLSLFSLRDEVFTLLQQPAYRKNQLAARMVEGEKLDVMVQQLTSDRRYALKFKRGRRDEYNHRVQELEEITDHARPLRVHSFLDLKSPEGGALKGGAAAVLLSGCIVASSTGGIDETFAGAATLATILFYSTIGANLVNFNYGHPCYQSPKMWEKIQYIDNILQKR